jgi:23S rRNA (cytidine1920-2'-O)/16S rRNA (cytidine1409-2'-O)-methyltransferase
MPAVAQKSRKQRLDTLLVERGIAPSREKARVSVLAGDVLVNGERVVRPATTVVSDATLELAQQPRYVSRGGEKLEHALEALGVDVAGLAALDVGASTGGFTTELLHRGCRRVYAVDVGHGQLRGTLRQDHRVVNLEATNAADLSAELIPDEIDVATVDVSYTPLAVIVPQVTERVRFANDAALLALVKPMFELQLGQLPDRDAQLDEAVLLATDGIAAAGWTIEEVITSPVTGNQGAIEQWVRARLAR